MSEIIMKQDKKVCIIVPVYNAEKYLGHCLNSVLSQTYGNWTAILVDDGSTDSSAEICRRYVALDPRFRLLSKPNGGVSSARNAGLELAEGDYLAFLDSDDCLSQDALEKQVSMATVYNVPLVVTNMTMLDFNNPREASRILLHSGRLGESPCYMSAEEFRAKRMRVIRNTSLLEGPCSKLYDLSLWKKLELHFPEGISLGEDFLANMRFYAACDGVVFLNENCYFYNWYSDSGSLTEKHRPNLFEIKMYLNEELEKHLGGRHNLSDEERDAFYYYVASSGLKSLEAVVGKSGLKQGALVSRVAEILDHNLFYESVCNAGYIAERFLPCKKYIKAKNCKAVIRKMRKGFRLEDARKKSGNTYYNPGILNRVLRKILKVVDARLPEGSWKRRLGAWESDIYGHGIKFAAKRRLSNLKKHLKRNLPPLNKQLDRHMERLREETTQLREETTQLREETTQLREENKRLEQKLSEQSSAIAEAVNSYTWISEQRMLKYAYQRDINELRQKKKAILLATAEHANIGDAAITLAEQVFLQTYFPDYYQVEISTYEFSQKAEFLHAIINPQDIIFLNGGGNMGDVYPEEEALHRIAVELFPNNKIIIFPQTIYFTDTETGAEELADSAKVYNRHKDLTLYVRGEESLKFAKEHFSRVKTQLMPDIVHVLKTDYGFERKGALLCLRNDLEGVLTEEQQDKLVLEVLSLAGSVDRTSNMYGCDVTREIRGKVVREELMRFAQHRVVVTDRLHGMIFSAVTGTPCVVLASFNQKIREYYHTYFRDSNAVFFVDDQTGDVSAAVQKALAVAEPRYPVLETNPHAVIKENAV